MNLFKSKWGQWTDLSTCAWSGKKYLLQARRHKNGKLQFRVEISKDCYMCDIPSLEVLELVTFKSEQNENDISIFLGIYIY